jgi:hypothetical protein
MRILQILAACAALGGCGLQLQEGMTATTMTPTRLGDQLVGQNLDTVIARLGPPSKSSQIDNDQTSHVWQLEAGTERGNTRSYAGPGGLYGDGYSPHGVSAGYSPSCRITATVAPTGIVSQASAEESNGTAATGLIGGGDSYCAQRLATKSRT